MQAFGDYVKKGELKIGQEASRLRSDAELRRAETLASHTERNDTVQLAKRVQFEIATVTAALVDAHFSPDVSLVLSSPALKRTSEPFRAMGDPPSEWAKNRAARRTARYLSRNHFLAWDIHSSYSYVLPDSEGTATNKLFLTPGRRLYIPGPNGLNYPNKSLKGYVFAQELQSYNFEDQRVLTAIREGLGYLVAKTGVSVQL